MPVNQTARVPQPHPTSPTSSHDRMLEAAKHLFSTRGYENTSTNAIARAAGTSESQMMKHFGSKEGLLEAIFDTGWTRMTEAFKTVSELGSPREKLEGLLDLVISSLDRDPELKELMLLEGRRIRKEGNMVLLTRGYLQFVGFVDAVLREMREQGQLRRELNVEAVRSALISMFEGLMRDQVLAKRVGFPAEYSTRDLRAIFLHIVDSLGK